MAIPHGNAHSKEVFVFFFFLSQKRPLADAISTLQLKPPQRSSVAQGSQWFMAVGQELWGTSTLKQPWLKVVEFVENDKKPRLNIERSLGWHAHIKLLAYACINVCKQLGTTRHMKGIRCGTWGSAPGA